MLEANRNKKRIILDHIRNYLPQAAHKIIEILFEDLFIKDLDLSQPKSVDIAVRRIKLMNKKVVLNYIFILKSMLISLKQ